MSTYSSDGKLARTSSPLRLPYGKKSCQFGELYLPLTPGPYPVVILIHGGFWRSAYDLTLMHRLAQDLAGQGIATWNIEYRRIGDAGGGWPGTFQDVASAADYLTVLALTYALELTRVVSVGHSAGGHLALWLAARPRLPAGSILKGRHAPLPLAGAVSLAGVSDLALACLLHLGNDAAAELLGGKPDTVPTHYAMASPAALLPLHIPQILIHGRKDKQVPLLVSQAYAEQAALAGDPVKLIELPGADHFVLIDPASTAWQTTKREIHSLHHEITFSHSNDNGSGNLHHNH